MKKKNAKIGMLSVALLYFVSYFILTLNGHYGAIAYGLSSNSNGDAILVPKFGYYWKVLGDHEYTRNGNWTLLAIIYCPLIYVDRKFWHTREKAESLEYPIKGYFDRETREYRDIQ